MKKSIILLVSALLSVGTIQAADPITKCYDEDATMTASPGDSHQWYKDGVKINGATNQSYTAVDLKASATYTCEVTTNGTSTNTGNLITLGGFEFPAKKPTLREENKLGDWIDYQYLNFDDKGVNIGIGACTTAKNANDVKTAYFSNLKPHSGDYLLVCDGASDPDARVWSARNLKLKGGVEYQFSCWAANIDKEYALHGANSLPKLKFVIENETGKHTLLEFTASTTLGEWNEYKATYTPPKDLNWCHIYIVNYTTEPAGNDFALDDVYFGTVINSAGSTKTETFNVTVYDTFEYKFDTDAVCPGTQATITTTLVPAHNGTLEPAANYKYEWKLNGTTPIVSKNKDLVVTAPSTVGSESYVLSTSSTVCYNSGGKSQTTSVKTKDCGRTETIDHPAVTVCTNQNVTLTCNKTGSSVKWSHDASLADTEITVTSSSTVNESNPDKYSCTYEITSNGITTTYTENFSVATKDCTGSNKEEQKVLIGGEVTISSNYAGTKDATFKWYKIEDDGTKTPVGDGSESITFTAQEGVTYECITTLPDGKVITETRVVIVYNDIEETVYVCEGEDITLTAKTANAYSYHWKVEGKEEILSTNQTLPLSEVTSKAKYTCSIVASDESTKITEIYNLEVNSNPELEIQVSATTAYVNINKGTAPYILVLDSDTTSTITVRAATYTLEELEEGQHILLATDKNKCKSSKSFNIHIPKLEPMIFFSPNNDGLNDLWLVKGIEDAANATIMIYDRYSKLLYKCKGADFKGWDGNYNGHGMVQDDYWYVISIPELEQQISGHFILKR